MNRYNTSNISLIVLLQKAGSLKSYICNKLEIPAKSALLDDLNVYLAISLNIIFFNSIQLNYIFITNKLYSQNFQTSPLLRLNFTEHTDDNFYIFYDFEKNTNNAFYKENLDLLKFFAKFVQYNKYLNYLDISGNNLSLKAFEILISEIKYKHLPETFELDLSSCEISDQYAQVLFNCLSSGMNLRFLKINFWNNNISSKGLKYLINLSVLLSKQNKRLQIGLQRNKIESMALFFSDEDKLKVLDIFDLSYNNLNLVEKTSSSLFVNISRTIFLDKLDLSYSKLKNDGLFHITDSLGKYFFVKSLILQSNEIDHEGCELLFNKLTKIFEKQEQYDIVRSKYLSGKESEENSYIIRTLDLSYNNLNKGEIFIANFLIRNFENSIENLILSSCNMGSIYLLYLAKGVHSNKRLKALDLSNNPRIESVFENFLLLLNGRNFSIVDDQEFCIAKSNSFSDSSLESLNLSHNKLSDESMKYLSNFLQENNSIKYIMLKYSDFSDDGLNFLVPALKYNTSLEELNLSDNQKFSLPYLFSLLSKYPSNLESLKVSFCNKFSFSDQDLLNFLLYGKHEKLKKLDISYNYIGSKKFEKIMSSLQAANRKIDHINFSANSLAENDMNIFLANTGIEDLFFKHINLKSNKIRIYENYIQDNEILKSFPQSYIFELSSDIDLNLISLLRGFPKIVLL